MKAHSKTYKITATTLTPVHIGSGRELQFNTDYLYFGQQKSIGVIEPEKLLRLIGAENIDTWVGYINQRKGIDEYIRNILKKNATPEEFSSRLIKMRGTPVNQQNVKEQLHNGTGRPYLPGSSIKGAVRTAFFTKLVKNDPGFVQNFNNLTRPTTKGPQYDGRRLMQHYLGDNPNNDAMRLFRLGDLYFANTECNLVKTVNLNGDDWKVKNAINQYVECIPTGSETEFTMQVFDYGDQTRDNFHKNTQTLLSHDYFQWINDQTDRLIYNEIGFWKQEGLPAVAEQYVENLEALYRKFENLEKDEMMIRVGFGGGFASITGDWQYDYMTENDYNDFTDRMRPARYQGLLFPKTRKFTESMQPLGFLLLKINQ